MSNVVSPLRRLPIRSVVATVLLVTALTLAAIYIPRLLSFDNITQVLRQFSVQAIMAVGVTFVMVAGRLDLSVGSLLSLCSVAAIGVNEAFGPVVAIGATLALGLAVGCFNGFLVAVLRLNSLIATLGVLAALQGVSLLVTGGKNLTVAVPDATWFALIGRGHLLGIPVPIVILVVLAAILAFVLTRTTFGRMVFAVGGNETASIYSSLPTSRIIFSTYVISGFTTAIAALVLASRVMSARNDSGSGYELLVVAGIILGGTSLVGGSGGIGRSVLGIVILGFIQNATLLLGYPYYFQWLLTWFVIIAAVWFDLAAKRGKLFI